MQYAAKVRAMLVAGGVFVAASGPIATALREETASYAAPTVLCCKVTLGETTTVTTPPSAPPTPCARLIVKADVPCGFTSTCCVSVAKRYE